MSRQQYIKDVCLSRLQNTSDLHNIRAMLYKKSYLTFQKLHQIESLITVNEAAEEYGDALREQIELVEQYYSEMPLNKEREVYLRLSAIWELCQIVFFSNHKDDIKSLMKWHNQINTPLYYEYDKQAIYFNPQGTFEHADFWPYVIRMATLGYVQEISSILKYILSDVSFSANSDILPFIVELYDITLSDSLDTEKLKKAIANLKSVSSLSPNIKYHADQIAIVISILSGNEAVTLNHTQDDIHAYISCRYYRPSVGLFTEFSARNPPLSRNHISTLPSPNILRSIIAGNIYQAIEECINYDWWLLAHLTDLLSMNGMIDREINIPVGTGSISMPVKTHFTLYYASFLKNQFGLWKQAYSYMLECGDLGKAAVIEHLNTMDLDVEDSLLMETVEFCISQSLEATGIELYKKKATLCMESKDYKKALFYYKESKQDQYIDTVFSQMTWHLAMTGNWFDLSTLDSVKYDGINYTIYRHLQNLHNYMAQSEIEHATNEFRALVLNDSVPDHVMPVIIWEGLALIKDLDTSLLTKSDLLHIKSKWQKLNKHASNQSFKLLYYYNKQDKTTKPENPENLESVLMFQRQEFLDATGVCFSRALERLIK